MTDVFIPADRFVSLVVAAEKTGKTGAIAALVNAGYRVILAAFDPGFISLRNQIDPDKAHNLIILPFEDRRGFQGPDSKITVGMVGAATAFAKFANFLNDGKARQAKCQGGEIIDLGPSEGWQGDTFLVVDNLTPMSDAAFERLLGMMGRNRLTKGKRDWQLAQAEVADLLKQMTSSVYNYHLIVLAHWDIQGPKEWEDEDKQKPDKADYNNELREREKDLVPTKMVPRSLGRALSKHICQHFPTVAWAEIDDQGRRIFNLAPTAFRDSGVPVRPGTLPKTLPIETGLLTIFRAVVGAPGAA